MLVSRHHWAAELVIHARGDDIGVLADMVGDEASSRDHVLVAHEQVIVLEAERPVRGKSILKANADRSTPAAFAGSVETHAGRNRRVLVIGDRGTTIYVEQRTVPSITDLASEQAEGINLGLVDGVGELQAGIVPREVGPVALRL